MRYWLLGLGVCVGVTLANIVSAQTYPDAFSYWPVDLKIGGTVIVNRSEQVGSLVEGDFAYRVIKQADGDKNPLSVVVLTDDSQTGDRFVQTMKPWSTKGEVIDFDVIDPEKLAELSDSEMKSRLQSADAVAILTISLLESEIESRIEAWGSELRGIVERGGTLLTAGTLATWLGRSGTNVIPDAVMFPSETSTDEIKRRLIDQPGAVGITLAEDTALTLDGRRMRLRSSGNATLVLPPSEHLPARVQTFVPGIGGRYQPYKTDIDWTAWRRDAIERHLPKFPADEPPPPNVENGTLFIVGGGGTPGGMMSRMVELAGGPEAKMVYIPCEEDETANSSGGMFRSWRLLGVKSMTFLHTKDRVRANEDDEFLDPLREATGVWFGGGRQWNLADSYFGTQANELMHDVLRRGGVIGGSSAGASIQGDYLARANPVANFDIMAPGYERGLGFLTGVAIDQHFTQRNRQPDMTSLVDRYPQLLGIGIDESTALMVQGSVGEVMGEGDVYFYDRRRPVVEGEPDYIVVGDGQQFDLVRREIVTPPDSTADSTDPES